MSGRFGRYGTWCGEPLSGHLLLPTCGCLFECSKEMGSTFESLMGLETEDMFVGEGTSMRPFG